MARRGKTDKVYVGSRVDAVVAAKMLNLATNNGISMNEALRRLIVQAILANCIPGVTRMELEEREAEKWGTAATPLYDGATDLKKKEDGRAMSRPPAE